MYAETLTRKFKSFGSLSLASFDVLWCFSYGYNCFCGKLVSAGFDW